MTSQISSVRANSLNGILTATVLIVLIAVAEGEVLAGVGVHGAKELVVLVVKL